MSDWQVGDLAVCVDDSPSWDGACYLTLNRIYTVAKVRIGWQFEDGYENPWDGIGLVLAEIPLPPEDDTFDPARFRKIRPDEHQACEEEFVKLLRRSKRRVDA